MPRRAAPQFLPIVRTFAYGQRGLCGAGVFCVLFLASALPAQAQGIILPGVGPVNDSMGGAAVACPIDSAGALHWNPASISGLPCSEMTFGVGLILPTAELSSSVPYGTGTLSGADGSESGVSAVPTMALVYKPEGSALSWGLGIFGVGGSRANYPASLTNPILFPQPQGLGRLSASLDVMQIDPTLAYQVTERLSVGFAPTITLANLIASPLFLGPQYPTTPGGSYIEGVGTRYAWGGGFQVGAYYATESGWHFGASYKSTQWMEAIRFRTHDDQGAPLDLQFRVDYPPIISVGTSYTGWENWVFACDVRYVAYSTTQGFGADGFASNGALTGLDWKDAYAVVLGLQRQVTERLSVRLGYGYTDNPITSEAAQYNVASPVLTQHTVHVGASFMFAPQWMAHLAYGHGFENSVSGPIHPAGLPPLPGTSVTSRTSADVLTAGFTKRF